MRKTIEHLISYLILGLGTCDIQIGKNVPLSSIITLLVCSHLGSHKWLIKAFYCSLDIFFNFTCESTIILKKKHAIETWVD